MQETLLSKETEVSCEPQSSPHSMLHKLNSCNYSSSTNGTEGTKGESKYDKKLLTSQTINK